VNNLGGITTIKSFTAERFEVGQVREESEAYRAANRDAIRWSSAFVPLIRMAILVGFTATLLFGGMEAVNGTMTVGTYSVLVFLTQRLLWPLTRLGETLDQYQRAMASTNRVMGLLDTPFEIHPGERRLTPAEVRGEVELRDVTFAYTGREPALHGVSLRVPAGATVGIVGATGSGKSTLVKLLLRLYEVEQGEILLDGIPLREMHLDDLRRAIGLVSQDTFLFHGTVRENIAYGSWGAEHDALERASRLAEAHDFISRLPQGYDTIVGERGQKLSGGQRQRIALARAILKDPPILILDEATSAVDNETEAAIQRSIEHLSHQRTTIAIAHRLSTVRTADVIYVLADGRVVERGRTRSWCRPGGSTPASGRCRRAARAGPARHDRTSGRAPSAERGAAPPRGSVRLAPFAAVPTTRHSPFRACRPVPAKPVKSELKQVREVAVELGIPALNRHPCPCADQWEPKCRDRERGVLGGTATVEPEAEP
jgi:ATP-binding cassette, subfamily B, bacterial